MKKTLKKKKATLEAANLAYKEVTNHVRALRELTADKRNLVVIEKYKTFTDFYTRAVERLKETIRPSALIGETVKFLFQEEDVISEVSVRGMPGADVYDMDIAWDDWPKPVLRNVCVIDPQKVKRLIEEGEFDEETAQEALLPNVPQTPRVSIKLLDAPKKKTP